MEAHYHRSRTLAGLALAASMLVLPGKGLAQDQDPRDLAYVMCARYIEAFLPGAYYQCAGSREYLKGNIGYAVWLYEAAARWGSKKAQYDLGLIYYQGKVVQPNRALGLAWLRLSAERPEDTQHREVADAAWRAAPAQLRAEASALLAAMMPRYADATARTRALNRFRRNIRGLEEEADWRPFDTFVVDGMPPLTASRALRMLNDGAAESLRLQIGPDGTVIVGAPEKVAAPPPDADARPEP